MEYHIECSCWDYKFSVSIDSCSTENIKEGLLHNEETIALIRWKSEEIIWDAIRSHEKIPMADFLDTDPIHNLVYTAAYKYIEQFANNANIKITCKQDEIDDRKVLESIRNGIKCLFESFIRDREECEQCYIDEGMAMINCLQSFLDQGCWQYGLRQEDGEILTDESKWPVPTITAEDVKWIDGNLELQPVLWFGLKDRKPEYWWYIDKSDERLEEWYSFWFPSIESDNWDDLFYHSQEGWIYITWMFTECGMDSPTLDNAIKDCPIELNKEDTKDELISKINRFFLLQQGQVSQ